MWRQVINALGYPHFTFRAILRMFRQLTKGLHQEHECDCVTASGLAIGCVTPVAWSVGCDCPIQYWWTRRFHETRNPKQQYCREHLWFYSLFLHVSQSAILSLIVAHVVTCAHLVNRMFDSIAQGIDWIPRTRTSDY